MSNLITILPMEKSFTLFCLTVAVIFAVVAYMVGNGGFSVFRCAGVGFCVFGVIAYVILAIICARKPKVTL